MQYQQAMPDMNAQDLKVVRRQPLFSSLPDHVFDKFVENVVPRTYPKGRIVFQRGDPAAYFYIVLDGWVKVYRDTPDGDEAILSMFSSGDMFAEAAAFMGMGYPASAEIVDESRLVPIESKRFTDTVRTMPEIAINMLGSMSRHLHTLVHEVERLKTRTASQRLVEFLLRRCRGQIGPAAVVLPYDKNLIAARLGIKPESLSRLLNKLRDQGVTTDQNVVKIADVGALREFCPADEVDQENNRTVA